MTHVRRPPTRDEAMDLLACAQQLYDLGGPIYENEGLGHDPDEWLGYILCIINDPAHVDPASFKGAFPSDDLGNGANVRALLRLATAAAVAKTLRWTLGEPWPDAPHMPVKASDVLDAIWLPDPPLEDEEEDEDPAW